MAKRNADRRRRLIFSVKRPALQPVFESILRRLQQVPLPADAWECNGGQKLGRDKEAIYSADDLRL